MSSDPSFPVGPPVAELVNRLAACPADFLAAPVVGTSGTVSVAAVIGDVVTELGSRLPDEWADYLLATADADAHRLNWLRSCLIAAWLVTDPHLRPAVAAERFVRFLAEDLYAAAAMVPAPQLVADPDRREELARLLLRAAGLIPRGESLGQATDRLATLDSVHRTQVEAEARAAEERARKVRAALKRKRAAEAAARASRE